MKFLKAVKNTHRIYKILRTLNSEGTSLPGKFLKKMYPNFLSESQDYVSGTKFSVTGTNGKTTTAGILSSILKAKGSNIIHNELGANMPNGIATAIALGLYKNFKAQGMQTSVDNFIIEVDEAYLKEVYQNIFFNYLIITNLFRDQLDRYGELDITKKKIQEGIKLNPNLKLVINADDPCLLNIDENIDDDMTFQNEKREKFYFGFNNVEFCDYEDKSNAPKEVVNCPNCNKSLCYTKVFYSQLGIFNCSCSLKRPKLDVSADVKIFRGYSILNVTYMDKTISYRIDLSGLYNAYNALGAIACAYAVGINRHVIAEGLKEYRPVFGREQNVKIRNKQMTLYLIKNPTGASEVLRTLKNVQNAKLLISINDDYADGRDISWLWDADFEVLSNFKNKIYITGKRADDMALRLKYAGVNPSFMVIDNDIKKMMNHSLKELKTNERLIVLPTYTSLLKINKLIKRMT